MRLKQLAGLSVFAAAVLASGSALATPVVYINGVGVPTGIVPGGLYLSSENSFENVITAPGQSFSGIFKVANIIEQAASQQTYTYGQNSAYLHGIFDGFTADTVIAPTATTAGQITFFGGSLRYYVSNTDTFTTCSGGPPCGPAGQPADFAGAGAGILWLDLDPAVIDAAGHTLVITIPANNGLGAFSNATATTFLDVVGGSAASAFNTNTFNTNPFSGPNDILFQGTANSGSPSDFPISGTNAIKANAVPEPLTLSLFGAGLAGAAAFGRRRKKA